MRRTISLLILITCQLWLFGQKPEGFTTRVRVSSTNVKDQGITGTCWSFATVSFLESEILRVQKQEVDLSETFFVRYVYPAKAVNYLRMRGKMQFGEGGQAHDVINVLRDYGAMTEAAFPSQCVPGEKLDHSELLRMLKGVLEAILSGKPEKLTNRWYAAVNGILDAYLGKLPDNFDYKGKLYSSRGFAKDVLAINPDDYIEITSFTHHPFYSHFRLEIPDNWSMDEYYNVPLDDMIRIMDNALANDYSIVWDGDNSETEFANKRGLAIVPLVEWDKKSKEEKDKTYTGQEIEKEITQAMRQQAFDNFTTTDDHLMHIVGIDVDKKGTKYYITKNSWGEDGNNFGGMIDMSESYVRLKTVAVMVHKNAVPSDIAKKMGLK